MSKRLPPPNPGATPFIHRSLLGRCSLATVPWLAALVAIPANSLWFMQRPWWQRLLGWAVCAIWSGVWGWFGRRRHRTEGFQAPPAVLVVMMAVLGAEGLVWGLSPAGVVVSAVLSAGATVIWAVMNFGTRLGRMKAVAATLATVLALGATEALVRARRIGEKARETSSRELARRFNNLTPPLSAYINEPTVLDEFPPALVEINSAGIRGPEVARGPVDLLLLGDSYVEARQLPWEETVGARLQQTLARRAPATRVLSHGMRGWAPLLEWNWYLKVGREFKPQVVLLFFFWNDLSSVGTEAELFKAVLRPDGRPDHFNAQVDPWWLWYKPLRVAALVDEVVRLTEVGTLKRLLRGGWIGTMRPAQRLDLPSAQRLARRIADEPPFTPDQLQALLQQPLDRVDADLRHAVHVGFWPGIRPMDVWWEEQRKSAQSTEATLAAFGDDVAATGGRLVIVYVPNPYQLTPSECSVGRFLDRVDKDVVLPPDSGTQSWLRAFSAAHRIEFIDPSDAMRQAAIARASTGLTPLYLRADCHWSAAGHQFMAEWLADWYLRSQQTR